MLSEESKKNRILEFSFMKFTTLGVTHVTMDDISRGVGIGKGTLYKFFPSKEALMSATIDFVASHMEAKIEAILNNEQLSTDEKLSLVLKTIGERLSKINPSVITYLERSMPEAYEKIVEIRKRIILTNMLRLFEEGKNNGFFDPKMDSTMVVHILIGAVNHITDEKILSTIDYSLDNILKSITTTILQGCLSEEGRRQTLQKG